MKPGKTFLFLFLVALVLLIIAFLFPEKGVYVSEDLKLHFLNPNKLIYTDSSKTPNITNIVEITASLQDTISKEELPVADSLDIKTDTSEFIPQPDKTFNPKKVVRALEFPSTNDTILYPFFRELYYAKSHHKLIRVLHYGDSQIESDRITSYIRNRLQKEFGGGGPGLQPPLPQYGKKNTIRHQITGNWKAYSIYGRQERYYNNRYGLMAYMAKFTQQDKSILPGIVFERSKKSYTTVKKYNQIQILFGFNSSPFTLEIYTNDSLLHSEIIEETFHPQLLTKSIPNDSKKISIQYKGESSPELYGYTLDENSGIAMDNIPMRGSSGTEFSKINKEILEYYFKKMQVKLILLEFGGNVAPTQAKDYSFYGNQFKKQLRIFKEIAPDVPVIVIGIADMSIKEGDSYVSFPNVEKIRDEMKKACLDNHYVYWDLYEAMGGANSMPQWVNAKPSLAAKDYIHFSSLGANVVAEMFYNALYKEYNQFYYDKINSKE